LSINILSLTPLAVYPHVDKSYFHANALSKSLFNS